jgi:threonine dehydrogenase-like Zn-dependent dehydrogenase
MRGPNGVHPRPETPSRSGPSVFYEGRTAFLAQDELPALGARDVEIRTAYSLPSVGTEMAILKGPDQEDDLQPGHRLGYSAVGVVRAIGPSVARFRIGDRVHASVPHGSMFVIPETFEYCWPIPPAVSDVDATFVTLGIVAAHLIERAEVVFGSTVIVVGLGTVGALAVQVARLAGAGTVIAVDIDVSRGERAVRIGAAAAIQPSQSALEAALRATAADAPPPILIEASGSPEAVEWCIANAPLHARVILAGTYPGPISVDPYGIVDRELQVVGAHQPKTPPVRGPYDLYSRLFNAEMILTQLATGRLQVQALVDGSVPAREIESWYRDAVAGRAKLRQPVFDWRNT